MTAHLPLPLYTGATARIQLQLVSARSKGIQTCPILGAIINNGAVRLMSDQELSEGRRYRDR